MRSATIPDLRSSSQNLDEFAYVEGETGGQRVLLDRKSKLFMVYFYSIYQCDNKYLSHGCGINK